MEAPQGETDRFRSFVRATYEDLTLYAMRRVGVSAADDVVSETYTIAWRKWMDPPPADPRPWLFGIARNIVRNELRRERRASRFSRSWRADQPVAAVSVDDEFRQAFASLSLDDQEILRLIAWDGLDPSQLAEALGIKHGAAATRLSSGTSPSRISIGGDMSTDVMDRLRQTNPYNANNAPTLTPEREALLMVAAKTEFSGPLRRSWLVAAAAGLVLGIGVMAIWFSGGSNSPVTTGRTLSQRARVLPPSDEQIATAEVVPATDGVLAEPGPIEQVHPIDIQCSTQLNDTNLACSNLIDGTTDYWNDLSLRGVGAVITVTFARPVQLEQVQFINVENDVSFRRNYTIRGIEIEVDDLPGLPFIGEIRNDNDRPHAITTPTLGTTQLIIRITATWPSEAIDGRAFEELALDEIQFWGRIVGTTQVARCRWNLTLNSASDHAHAGDYFRS